MTCDPMFNMHAAPREALRSDEVLPGDVYPNQHGGVFVIISVRGTTAYYIGINTEGEVVRTGQYGTHALRRRALLGRADLPTGINIEWLDG